MGVAEHLKTLCCLGLPPESATIAVSSLLHELLPHGWSRIALLETDATIGSCYPENPAAATIFRERMWRFIDDPLSPASLWMSAFRANAIGWTLPLQGKDWLDSGWYREIEAPLDSCWILDAMIGDTGQSFSLAHLMLTRPRGSRPFTLDDIQRLDRLRPWLAHALRPRALADVLTEDHDYVGMAGAPVLSGQIILTSDAKVMFQTAGLEHLFRILGGERANYMQQVPLRDRLPEPILKLLQCIRGAANGTSNAPPRMQVSTAHGVVTLEAKWLVSADATPTDVAKDPKSCLIAVTIELLEHAIAYAARVLRKNGATPAQVKVGIHLALGKTKPEIADELGLQLSSVADLTKKLYSNLDVHNSAELGAKIWAGQKQDEKHQSLRHFG
ncbi:MAG: helix-turn-helix transcriptional regulator [Methylocella sp.]